MPYSENEGYANSFYHGFTLESLEKIRNTLLLHEYEIHPHAHPFTPSKNSMGSLKSTLYFSIGRPLPEPG